MTPPPCRVGLVGAGSTAAAYVTALRQTPGFEVCSVATRTAATGTAFAHTHALAWMSVEALLADPTIDLVLNLTPPLAHAEVSQAALKSGKHVYSEKPLAATSAQAKDLIALADDRSQMLACAPATLLQPPLATLRRLLAAGDLGTIVSALACIVYEGPELFHSEPAHLYGPAAGPLYDMGVYPLTALLALLGPVCAVQAFASRDRAERQVRVGPRAGSRFPVSMPTTVHASLHHVAGTISTLILSFDAMGSRANGLELHGTRAAAHVPLGNKADPAVLICRSFGDWQPVPAVAQAGPGDFAAGVVEAWTAFDAGRAAFASATRALETLVVLEAIMTTVQGSSSSAAEPMLTPGRI
jgi:predicted dehydrogenase